MKKALIVYGGWDGHTPEESAKVFAPFLADEGYDVTLSDTLDSYTDESLMGEVDLIVPIWTMGELSSDQSKGLRNAVRQGAGLAGFHGGIIDSFRQDVTYQWMTGGQWVAHPGGVIERYEVTITDSDHEITAGIDDFQLVDTEQYYLHVDPAVHVLATTTFTGEHGETDLYPAGTVMPYAWTRNWGEGRVFVAAWGHTYKDFDVPEAKEIVQRGMLWASR
ncbi:MAG: ThuA domain-containing protein [Phycisphaeraceae bacterium]|nr:ThuA domain-containing protein [Phycisphaeraceae bacterium]